MKVCKGGGAHALLLKDDTTVWAWGHANYGQLGNGVIDETGIAIPVQVKGPGGVGFLTDIIDIVASGEASLALKSDGTLWAWGYGGSGQMGQGGADWEDKLYPVQVKDEAGTGFLTGITKIAAGGGGQHFLALKSDNTIVGWGANQFGQTGNGLVGININLPAPVVGVGGVGVLADISDISAGGEFSLAMKVDGTVYAWGWNQFGQLGNGNEIDSGNPVLTLITNVSKFCGGGQHTLAVKIDGTVWAWGSNQYGQLGDGSVAAFASTPVQVKGIGGDGVLASAVDVVCGGGYSSALRTDFTVYAWGDNSNGSLGDGTDTDSHYPVLVKDIVDAQSIGGTNEAVFAVNSSGNIHAWGQGILGQLGDGQKVNQNRYSYVALGKTFLYYSVSREGDSELLPDLIETNFIVSGGADNTIYNFRNLGSGWYEFGVTANQLALTVHVTGVDGYTKSNYIKTDIADLSFLKRFFIMKFGLKVIVADERGESILKTFDDIAKANNETVLAIIDGEGWTWGSDHFGGTNFLPVKIAGLTNIIAVASGSSTCYALKSDGTVWAWGMGGGGQLGNGTNDDSAVPVQVSIADVSAISSGLDAGTVYALKSDGTLWAWGDGSNGQLGNGTNDNSNIPVQVTIADVVAVASYFHGAGAVKEDGTVWCWGRGDYGQIGNGAKLDSNVPVQALIADAVIKISAGYRIFYVIKSDGTVWVWGRGLYGSLGIGIEKNTYPVPTQITALSDIDDIASGRDFALALKTDGKVYAWGRNYEGQLGNNIDQTVIPYQTLPLWIMGDVKKIGAAGSSGFVLKNDGTIYSWGEGNTTGVLGIGTNSGSKIPARIEGFSTVTFRTLQPEVKVQQGDKTVYYFKDNIGSGALSIKRGEMIDAEVTNAGLLDITTSQDEQIVITMGDYPVVSAPIIASVNIKGLVFAGGIPPTSDDSTDPGVSNVLEGVDYVIDGVAKEGIYKTTAVNDVRYGVTFGPNGTLIGNFPPLVPGTSFTDVIAALKIILENDSQLQAYAQSKWSKNIQVWPIFKHRTEINLTDLPVILITRPVVEVEQENNVAFERKNTVKLYIGFQEEDRNKAQEEIVKIEELIEHALLQDPTLAGMVDNVSPGNSANDEGYFHPAYFIVKEFLILKEEVWR